MLSSFRKGNQVLPHKPIPDLAQQTALLNGYKHGYIPS
jgi:hypothetical protein